MLFHTSNFEDLKKYYSGNIIKVPVAGDWLFQIKNITPSFVDLVDVNGKLWRIDMEEGYQIDFLLPTRVVYQWRDKAALVYRKPAKQYNRGVHPENTGWAVLNEAGLWSCHHISLEILQEFVDKPCYQDVNHLDSTYLSWAISPYCSIAAGGQVYFLFAHVAQVKSFSEKKLQIKTSLFKPELQELFQGWEISE